MVRAQWYLLGMSSMILPSVALAQGAMTPVAESDTSEIVVTAQKRSENVQNVPISITALSGDQLAQRQIRAAEDLVSSVPNLQVNSPLGEGLPVFSLRGITMSDISLAQNGPIAVYYDEVYKGNFSIQGLGLFDLERVEVLKGPQGTLYGKNTTGGAINLISRKPSFKTGGSLAVGYGNYGRVTADGAVEAGLAEGLGARVAFTFERAHGWIKNAFPDAHDAESTRQYGIRGSLRFQPNDVLDITIRGSTTLQNPYSYGNVAIPGPDGVGAPIYPAFGLPANFRTGLGRREIDTPNVFRRRARTYALAANADLQLSDALTLTSISSWDRGSILIIEDSDGTPVQLAVPVYKGRTKQITQDLRLTSSFSGPFDFIVGGYFSNEKIVNSTSIDFLTDIDVDGNGTIDAQDCLNVNSGGLIACNMFNHFNQEKTSIAVYSDASYKVTDRLTLRGGLRYTHDKGELRDFIAQRRAPDTHIPIMRTIPDPAAPEETASRQFTNNNISGKIGIDYTPAERVLLYASYSRGYRASSFNAQAFFDPGELSTAKPEKVASAEVGFKTELFDRRVRLNGALFWYDYKNQQTLVVDPSTSIQQLVNLPKSRILGAEADLQVRPTSRLTFSAGFGLLDTKILRAPPQNPEDRGNRLISAPKLTFTSSVDWTIPVRSLGAVDLRVDVSHSSGQYYDLHNSEASFEDGFTLLNARARFHTDPDRYGLALWMKNITNEYYHTNRIDSAGFGYTYTHVNEPRTYGLTLDAKF